MDNNARIAQWENMTQADPTNDMAWFSLGNAYKDANRPADAEKALAKTLELNPIMSRAYQLRGQVLIALNENDKAAEVLTKGYSIAAERGDVMPQRAMGSLLEKIGKPVPQVKSAQAAAPVPTGANAIIDRKTGQPGTRLPDQPMRGPIGKFILDHFSNETWQLWIRQGTKVINELRLDFSNDAHQRTYEDQMIEWLGFTRDEADEYAKGVGAK
ncbi:MAG: Fe(2+)-trafficking protein [Planctomycetota bacterium]|nr:Fe(2+)-trafficking protein [Planctomycetota bacterium]